MLLRPTSHLRNLAPLANVLRPTEAEVRRRNRFAAMGPRPTPPTRNWSSPKLARIPQRDAKALHLRLQLSLRKAEGGKRKKLLPLPRRNDVVPTIRAAPEALLPNGLGARVTRPRVGRRKSLPHIGRRKSLPHLDRADLADTKNETNMMNLRQRAIALRKSPPVVIMIAQIRNETRGGTVVDVMGREIVPRTEGARRRRMRGGGNERIASIKMIAARITAGRINV